MQTFNTVIFIFFFPLRSCKWQKKKCIFDLLCAVISRCHCMCCVVGCKRSASSTTLWLVCFIAPVCVTFIAATCVARRVGTRTVLCTALRTFYYITLVCIQLQFNSYSPSNHLISVWWWQCSLTNYPSRWASLKAALVWGYSRRLYVSNKRTMTMLYFHQ